MTSILKRLQARAETPRDQFRSIRWSYGPGSMAMLADTDWPGGINPDRGVGPLHLSDTLAYLWDRAERGMVVEMHDDETRTVSWYDVKPRPCGSCGEPVYAAEGCDDCMEVEA